MREQPQHYVGIDIGTSSVRCIVGVIDQQDQSKVSIIGHGLSTNLGMRKGVIAHIDDVTDAIIKAINQAEQVSGIHIQSATVNINGSHIAGLNSRGVVAISTANKEITTSDVSRVEEAATVIKLPPNREIIQVFAKNYRIDGQDNIKDPVGMQGIRLEVDTHIVTALSSNLKNVDLVLEKAHVRPTNYTVPSLASAEAVLSRQQKESGTLLVDIGAGTTNMVVVEDGEVQYVGVIPVGGIHLTNDLAIGLKTDLDIAEAVKVQHAGLGDQAKIGTISVSIQKKNYSFDADEVAMITEARVEELFELISKELKRIHKSQKLPGGVVIVGGMAKMPGIADFAREKLQLAARIGKAQPIGGLIDTVNDPAFATSIGLMILDILLLPASSQRSGSGHDNGNVFGVLGGVWHKIKKNK